MGDNDTSRLLLETFQDVILDSINEGVFTVDMDWRITSFNRAAERITNINRQDAIGHLCSEVLRASVCEHACVLRKTLESGRPATDATVFIVNSKGDRIPIKVSAAALVDHRGVVMGGVETFQDLRKLEELRKKLVDKRSLNDIVGQSPAITELLDLLPQIADSASNVLIGGASGTGKELFARAIHDLSPRRRRRFVAVNCGALPDTLLESELFGYKAGAFTDARRDKEGRFSLANGGTLFLDEIGDVTPAMQVRLLRVLQERTYEPLGAVEPVQTDIRVIAATNKDLKKLVGEGTFREDLFYRIHVIHIDIPSLRDRRSDIPLLAEHFVSMFNRHQERDVTGISSEALDLLMAHNFPGNVRELQNAIEHAFVLCHGGQIRLEHLPPYLREDQMRIPPGELAGSDLRSMEKLLISETLRQYAGNRRRTAKALGIDPSTLYRKIKKLEIDLPDTDGRNPVSTGRQSHLNRTSRPR